jgi:copper(I)-binding protein
MGGAATTAAMGGAATTAMGGSGTTAMGGSMGGAMKMQPVARIVVPAKGTAELKPGGYHVMLLELAKPLVKGESFDATLTFESGATSTVKIEVRDQA